MSLSKQKLQPLIVPISTVIIVGASHPQNRKGRNPISANFTEEDSVEYRMKLNFGPIVIDLNFHCLFDSNLLC